MLGLALSAGLVWAGVGAAQRLPKSTRTGWYFVDKQDGVLVQAHDHPGRELPTLRGIGDVQADFFAIAAVLADVTRHNEWMPNCSLGERVARASDFDQIFYHKIWAPWPVTDRDLVFRVRTQYRPRHGEMLTRFYAVSHAAHPPQAGVVRMTKLDGYYHLLALDDEVTRVTMQVDIDPGGMVPDWLVKSETRTYPLNTLRGLREQLRRTRGVYDAERVRLKAEHGAYTAPAQMDEDGGRRAAQR